MRYLIMTAAALAASTCCCEGGVQKSAPKVSLVWSIPVGAVRWMDFSPSGNHLSIITPGGGVRAFTSSGAQCWSSRAPEADRTVVSPDGAFTLVYPRMNPVDSHLIFLDGGGRVCWKMEVSGAVWCADVSRFSRRGARFAIGTGRGYVYVVDLAGRKRSYRRWRAPGAVVSIALGHDGERVTVGTWQRSAIECRTARGTRVWEADADQDSLQYVQQLHVLYRLFVRIAPNRIGGCGECALFNSEGRRISGGKLATAEKSRVLVSPNGRYVCVGRTKLIEHKGKSTPERHAILMRTSGKKLWEKGSLLFQADPIAVTSRGEVLVSSEKNALFVVTRSGDLEPSIKLPAAIDRSAVSRDGSRILLHCADGKLYMLRLSE